MIRTVLEAKPARPFHRISAFEVEATIPNENLIGHRFNHEGLTDAQYRSKLGVSENNFKLILKGNNFGLNYSAKTTKLK